MRISIKILRAEYDQEVDQPHQEDRRTGTVTVYYSNGTFQEFVHIDRAEFFDWERRRFDYKQPPSGVRTKPPIVELDRREIEPESIPVEQENTRQKRRARMFKLADDALAGRQESKD
jgi:hypothetical protein